VKIDFGAFEAILLDLDGTIYHEEHALPGAVELIHRLQREGRKYACLTNSTSSPHRLAERLQRMGVEVDPDHIYTAAAAAADYVLGTWPNPPRVFNLATEGIHEMLDGKVIWVNSQSQPCDAVIVGVPLSVHASNDDRRRTAMLLARSGAALIGICADRVYPSPRGMEFGVGALTAMLAYAANVSPVFCGKPEKLFFHELCRRVGADPRQCLLIGDNLESDIAGATAVGMQTALVLTGVSTSQDAAKLPEPMRPQWVISGLDDV
jgi:4-nitrophenyl phosphatase